MIDIFILKLLISFIIGGLWTILSTISAEKFGTRIGGLVTGLPSTTLFALLFIAWTQSVQVSVEATTIMPAIIGIDSLFLVVYVYFLKRNIWLALTASVFFWAILSFGLLLLKLNNLEISLSIYVVLLLIAYYFIFFVFKIKSDTSKRIKYTAKLILFRGLFSGFIISFSVLMAKIGGPVLGGIFATFPAMYISTLLIAHFAHGASFSSSIAKSSLLAASSVVIYTIFVRLTYINSGVLFGTIISLLISYAAAYLLYNNVIKKIS